MTVGVERPQKVPSIAAHRVVKVHPNDNVAVAVDALESGSTFSIDRKYEARASIPAGPDLLPGGRGPARRGTPGPEERQGLLSLREGRSHAP